MKIRLLLPVFLAVLMLLTPGRSGAQNPISTVGLNLYRDSPVHHDFWLDCGYNTLEFLDQSWWFKPALHPDYFDAFAAEISAAQADGFKVYVILCSNILQWTGPADTGGAGYLTRFDPTDGTAMSTRLDYLETVITELAGADGFIFLAGDPGGNSDTFNTTSSQFISMARDVRDLVYAHAGANKEFIVNTWAISYWMGSPTSAYTRALWDEEIQGSKDIVNASNLIGSLTGSGGRRVGISYSVDNYYRPLALGTYAASPSPAMEYYPLAATISTIAGRGTGLQWAWPYFLVDEADDAYNTNGSVQAEIRYIRQHVNDMRTVGVNGIIGNLSFNGREAEIFNAYALARFCLPTTATTTAASIDDVYHEFASFIATQDTTGTFENVMRFLENKSTWHGSLPAAKQLSALADGNTLTAFRALTRLRRTQPNPSPSISLPEPTREYLKRVKARLETLADAEADPCASVDSLGGELFGLNGTNWAGDANTEGGLDDAMSTAEDRATAVVSSNIAVTGFPSRFDQPLTLRRSHDPATIRIGYRRNSVQHTAGLVYWDDVLIGSINANHGTDSLAYADLTVPNSIKDDWAYFAKGPHVLTIEVPYNASVTRYFEVDSVWLVDKPKSYQQGFTWDLLADYSATTAQLEDVGSLNLPVNEGLSSAAPNGAVWTLGYYTSQPFNPATQSLNPAAVSPMTAGTVTGYVGTAHTESGYNERAQIGQVDLHKYESIGGSRMSVYAKGHGSAAIPTVGTSVSPAIIAFEAPHNGQYDVDVALTGRTSGWRGAVTIYRESSIVGARQTFYNGSAMTFDLNAVVLKAGERLFFVFEGYSNAAWSEVLIDQLKVKLVQREKYDAGFLWNLSADYSSSSAIFGDAGSVAANSDWTVINGNASTDTWRLGWCTSPFSTSISSMTDAVATGYYGDAHHDPATAPWSDPAKKDRGPAIGRLTNTLMAPGAIGDFYAEGLGDGTNPTRLATISFKAPQDGDYQIYSNFLGRDGSGYCRVQVWKNSTKISPTRSLQQSTPSGGPLFEDDLTATGLVAGDRLHVAIEGTLDPNWCELLLQQLTVELLP